MYSLSLVVVQLLQVVLKEVFVKTGEPVEIVGLQEKSMTSTCTGVEMFRKILISVKLVIT
jgi:translation elongation factor EF-Tu-like GTPase